MPVDFLKIGQLAKKSGLTVRALHWYDQISLLKPSRHTESGHRLYTAKDIVRLQQIKSLQELGFSLNEIKHILSAPRFDPAEIIQKQLEFLEARIEQHIRLRQRLQSLAIYYRTGKKIAAGQLLETIKEITQMEKYYTPEQLDKLRRRRELLGEKTIRRAEEEWQELLGKYKSELEKGTDPASAPVQALAKRSWELIAAFTGGDAGIEQSLGKMYQQEGGPEVMGRHGLQLDPHVWEYMGRAMQAYKKANPEK